MGLDLRFEASVDPQSLEDDWSATLASLPGPIEDLSEDEENELRYQTKVHRFQLLHFGEFRRLLSVVHDFVHELSMAGGQDLLAKRAGMGELEPSRWPSATVRFGPLPLPDPGVPYRAILEPLPSAGAKVLWWCAAAVSPNEFGYLPDLGWQVWSGLRWICIVGEKAYPNRELLDVMKEAASYVIGLVNEPKPSAQGDVCQPVDQTAAYRPPPPVSTTGLRLSIDSSGSTVTLDGVKERLAPEQVKFIRILLDARGAWVSRREMGEMTPLLQPRADRIRDRLPKRILDLTDSGYRGYRLKWNELE
jgi:hypothetical protein